MSDKPKHQPSEEDRIKEVADEAAGEAARIIDEKAEELSLEELMAHPDLAKSFEAQEHRMDVQTAVRLKKEASQKVRETLASGNLAELHSAREAERLASSALKSLNSKEKEELKELQAEEVVETVVEAEPIPLEVVANTDDMVARVSSHIAEMPDSLNTKERLSVKVEEAAIKEVNTVEAALSSRRDLFRAELLARRVNRFENHLKENLERERSFGEIVRSLEERIEEEKDNPKIKELEELLAKVKDSTVSPRDPKWQENWQQIKKVIDKLSPKAKQHPTAIEAFTRITRGQDIGHRGIESKELPGYLEAQEDFWVLHDYLKELSMIHPDQEIYDQVWKARADFYDALDLTAIEGSSELKLNPIVYEKKSMQMVRALNESLSGYAVEAKLKVEQAIGKEVMDFDSYRKERVA